MQVALIQFECDCLDGAKFSQLVKNIEGAASKGAQVIVLPELCFHTYFCRVEDPGLFKLAHAPDAEHMEALRQLAEKWKVVLVVPFFEKQSAGLYYNSCAVYDADGSDLGIYRKMHIPHDPGFNEKYYFTPGDLGYKCFKTKYGNIGVLICWDQWFPEAARLTAMQGADLIVYPTAIGWDSEELSNMEQSSVARLKEKQLKAWRGMHIGHAISNGCYVAAVNRIGTEGQLTFWGHSFICDPFGEVLEELDWGSKAVLMKDIDLSIIEKTRVIWPFFRDRRVDSYEPLAKRWLQK